MADSATWQRLVVLRVLLREAVAQGADRTRIGRHRALILLDGACEYALGLALHEHSLKLDQPFPAKLARLVGHFGARWDQRGRKGVLDMHTARNQAQHSGTVPDADELPVWTADAETFIRSLVAVAHGVNLDDVFSADAVSDDSIRQQLRTAEASLDSGDSAAATEQLGKTFEEARRRWRNERSSVFRTESTPISTQDFTASYVREAVETMEELAEIEPFAADLGEYVWFKTVQRDSASGVETPIGDARRAFVFVLDWILRWEAFSARFVKDRRGAWRRRLVAPATDDPSDEPVILSADVRVIKRVRTEHETLLAVDIQLADLPEDDREGWLEALQDAFYRRPRATERDGAETQGVPDWKRASVRPDGIVSFHNVPATARPDDILSHVRVALTAANKAHAQRIDRMRQWESKAPALRAEYQAAVDDIRVMGEPLFGEVRLSPHHTDGDVDFRVLVPIRFRVTKENYHDVWKAFNDAGGGSGFLRFDVSEGGLLAFGSVEKPETVREVATRAAGSLEQYRSHVQEKADEDETHRASLQSGLDEKLKPLRITGKGPADRTER